MLKFQFKPQESLLLVIDIQERLHQAMEEASKTAYIKNSGILIKTAQAFNMPIVVSEQYPRGLGPTIPEIKSLLGGATVHEKLAFSCWGEAPIRASIESGKRSTVIVIGIETHVCVLQTVMDLIASGYNAVVASDAVCSRNASDRVTALAAMAAAGAVAYSTESIAFMLLERAGTPEFKQISPLFK